MEGGIEAWLAAGFETDIVDSATEGFTAPTD
ncbi:MAG: hypothetical protein ACI8Z1_002322 [Candidatus Azotimanducaceae bacterium]|jgi:hypothetical protein